MSTNPTPQEVLTNALPDHDLVGQPPTMTSACNGVGCGCHPSTTVEPDRTTR